MYAQQKQLLRKQTRQTIKNLTTIERQYASLQITNLILSNLTEKFLNNTDTQNVACYWPTNHEINTIELINKLLINSIPCYLPVINDQTQALDFVKYTNKTKLIENKFGILEPEFTIDQKININQLDLIFMPLVAFDKLGHRIGSGSGLYDRSLISDGQKISCKLIGLAYSCQQVPNFTPNDWDINLDFVVTEREWLGPFKK